MDILFPKRNQVESRASERREPMGLFTRGQTWWMRFTYKGKQIRKSTETDDKKLAVRIYQKVMGEVAEGKWFEKLPGEEKTFREMMEKYMSRAFSQEQGSKRLTSVIGASKDHSPQLFWRPTLTEITPKLISEYKTKRREEEAAPKTINKSLS